MESKTIELPIFQYKQEIMEKINKHRVTIIIGSTGCGKTLKVPQFIYEASNDCNIIISQPRKIAAITVAKRIAVELKSDLGSLVGYQIGLSKKANENESSKILFCTTGVLLQKLIHKKDIGQYSHIILDEVHEREIDMDLLITIIRDLLLINNTTKVILMSSTIDPTIFINYFKVQYGEGYEIPAVVMMKDQQNFPVQTYYLSDLHDSLFSDAMINYSVPFISSELYRLAAKLILIHLSENPSSSILIFLPGIYEIESLNSILAKADELTDKYIISVLHSSLSVDKQRQVFYRASLPRVILSTNIAESSVTIPDIGCVIDFCLTKNFVSTKSSLSMLKLDWAAKYNLKQRAGRTGRVCSGVVYRLIDRDFYELNTSTEIAPEMQRTPLETTILRIKILDREPPFEFLGKCMSPPDKSVTQNAILTLKEVGAIKMTNVHNNFDYFDGDLTFIGRVMASLPLHVRISKLIILGYVYSVLDDAIIIAAGLSIRSIFKNCFYKKLDAYSHLLQWANGSGCDSIAMLNAYKYWQHTREKGIFGSAENEEMWCNNFNLDRKNLYEMRQLIFEIQQRLSNHEIESLVGKKKVTWRDEEKSLILKVCIAGAFIPNYFIQGKSDLISEREVYKTLAGLDASRTVYLRKFNSELTFEVYEEQIKKSLITAGIVRNSKDVKLHFHQTKIFIEFPTDNKLLIDNEIYESNILSENFAAPPGKIIPEVYRAIKFRKISVKANMLANQIRQNKRTLNSSIQLKVISTEKTREYAIQKNLGKIIDGVFKIQKKLYIDPNLCILPQFDTAEMDGMITHIDHCSRFFVQPLGFNQMVLSEIENELPNEELLTVKHPKVNELVIASYDGSLKRAKITFVYPGEKFLDCFFIDYGYTYKISIEKIFKLNEEDKETYFGIHERCFECRLSNIEPNYVKCPRGKWSLQSITEFSRLVLHKKVICEIYSVVDDIVSVQLNVEGINVNDYLVNQNFASKCEESYVSRLNHNERQNIINSLSKWISREMEFKDKENQLLKASIEPPPECEWDSKVRLEGPFSPLETDIEEISSRFQGGIKIDPLSVNSVILDDNVENYEGKLIVASEVSETQDEGKILHNVSMMPELPGLPVLLSLIFAPQIAFVRNEDRTRINYIYFGLGADSKLKRPYFAVHDSLLPVNFPLVQKDIDDINELRAATSCLLHNEHHKERPELSEAQKRDLLHNVKRLILKIILQNRQYYDKSERIYQKSFNNWITDDQSDMPKIDNIDTVYPQIAFPPLYNEK